MATSVYISDNERKTIQKRFPNLKVSSFVHMAIKNELERTSKVSE